MGYPFPSNRRVRDAVVLAAGNGDRFRHGSPRSKLLTPIAGVPLLARTLVAAYHAGISNAHVVLGYDAARVAELAESAAPDGLYVHFHVNHDWHQENGVSVLTTRECLPDRPFALLMGDHLFEAAALQRLLAAPRQAGQTLLCVDRRPAPAAVAAEATRVRMAGGSITAIGKMLEPYDALDTGLFVCDPSLFGALTEACREGDTTLTGGIRKLTTRGLVGGIDIGAASWCDVDTVEDVRLAERVVTAPAGSGARPRVMSASGSR